MATAGMTGIFEAAVTRGAELQDWVTSRQEDAIDKANAMRDSAIAGIDAMATFIPSLDPLLPAPTAPTVNLNISGDMNLPPLSSGSFGQVSDVDRPDFVMGSIDPVAPVQIDDFVLDLTTIHIPAAPEERDYGDVPTKPTLAPITLPDAPVLNRPTMPALTDITIPDFVFPTLPTFTDVPPELEETAVSEVLQWSETPYQVEILDEVMDKLRGMWSGGLGLPPAVEQALWERAASREDMGAARDISAAAIEFSSRGYSMPPGMMVNRLDTIRADAGLRKSALARDILLKVADTQIENLRFACTQAMAAEQVLISVWMAVAQRDFEAAKYQMEAQLALLAARVSIFNARQSARATDATIYRAKLDGALAHLQMFRMQLDAEIARGTINEQRVRVYSELVRAMLADVEVYKAEMSGKQIESDIQKNAIETFKSEIQAFGEVIRADKTRFEVFETIVKGETAKADLQESRGRAYAAYVSGKSAKAEIAIRNQAAQISKAELQLRAYQSNLEKDKNLVQAQSAAIGANAEAHRANTARFVAQAQAQGTRVELDIKAQEAIMRTSISLYEVEVRKFMAIMEQQIRAAGLQLEAVKSAGQATATLAAGAMAGVSIGASVSAGASIGASGSEATSISLNTAP